MAKENKLVRGVLSGNERGFAFLDDYFCEGRGCGLFIAAKNLNGAMHGDTVTVKKIKYAGKIEGEVVEIVSRGVKQLVGTVDRKGATVFVVPDDKRFFKDIYIPAGKEAGAVNGHKVVVKITRYPERNPEGEITGILGFAGDKGVSALCIAAQYGIKQEFSAQAENEAGKLPQEVTAAELNGRKDFRGIATFTIDGEDTKDFDDAVSISRNDDGTFKLGVHIADVAHYVKPNCAVDREAYERGTSVYFPDAVFPMLPVALSNGICSLNPGADRLTLSCVMDVDKSGTVKNFEICESVIKSGSRLTYTEAAKMLDTDLKLMGELAEILTAKRRRRGCLDFNSTEVKFEFDADGAAENIVPVERTAAHRLIEEFMVLANETVAEYATAKNLPFVYRTHEKPAEEKLSDLNHFLRGLGLSVKADLNAVKPMDLQKVLNLADGKPYARLVSGVMLRSLQKARYHPANLGHFGLASECYCHFTSPIRRYPDLIVHRVLKTSLKKERDEKYLASLRAFAEKASAHCTEKEISADAAERAVDDMKKAEYAARHVGESFCGVVSGVTDFGIFVELENTLEGLVHIDLLPHDRYELDEKLFTLTGRKHKFTFGQKLNVTIAKADAETRRIDFALI